MPPRVALRLLLLALVAELASPSPARAWTRSVVQSAGAKVDIHEDGTLAVLLRLDVEVQAGWLHELELVGLGDDFDLDRYRPPYFRSEEGEVYRPEIEEVHEDGRIRLWFPRREAPRRGEYRVFLRYRAKADVRTVQLEGAKAGRVTWSLPAWETGLHDVSVELRAPKGSSVPDEMRSGPPGVDFQIAERSNRLVAHWRRIHLPRMTEWPLAVDVPAKSIALPASTTATPSPPGFQPLPKPGQRPIAWELGLLAVLGLLKRRFVETKLGRERLWFRVSWPKALMAAACAVALGQWQVASDLYSALALIALTLHRPHGANAPPVQRAWRPIGFSELLKPGIHPGDLLDATTSSGLAALLAVSGCLIATGQPESALLALPIFLCGTRYHMAPSIVHASRMLRAFASQLWLPADAPELSFGWELASDGTPRLRVYLPVGHAGLLALGFAVMASAPGFLRRHRVMLMVETRAQSSADDVVRRRTKVEPDLRASNGTIVRVIAWDARALELLRVLARKPPKPMKASRGTWLLNEISEPRSEAA